MKRAYVECELRNIDFHKHSFEEIIVFVRDCNDIPLSISFKKSDVLIENDKAYAPCEIRTESITGNNVGLHLGTQRSRWTVSGCSILNKE